MRKGNIFVLLASLLVILALLLSGCGASNHSGESGLEKYALSSSDAAPASPQAEMAYGYSSVSSEEKASATSNITDVQRKIIKRAYLTQKVTELEPALDRLGELIDGSHGYIQSSTIRERGNGDREAYYVLRVPEENYASILGELQEIGKNVSISQSGDDVTEEFYDNEARIKNLKLQEEAVQKLYDRADAMEDILKIQQELFRIRDNIEQLEGRNRYLDNLSSLSTIEITIHEVKPVDYVRDHEDSTWSRAKEGFIDSLQGISRFFKNLFVFLVTSLPVLVLILLPLGLFIWWIVYMSNRGSKVREVKNVDETQGKMNSESEKAENSLDDDKETKESNENYEHKEEEDK